MNIKNDKGITMIILVVTLIVMAILSTMFVFATLDNGTIRKAEELVDLNNNLINTTKDNEKNLLVQDTVDFKVEDTTKDENNNE